MKWFNGLPRLVQIILLLIPGVNWIVEIVVRFSCAIEKPTLLHILIAILMIVIGLPFGWIDCLACLFLHHLLFAA